MPLTIDKITTAIRAHKPVNFQLQPHTRQAAVAVILKVEQVHTQALFILRASHEGDPWSGHMAFPGGHLEETDNCLREAAERETLEEIGLDLAVHGRFIGQIDPVRANPRGRNLDMIVAPFVYLLETKDATMTANYEVADILWGSLNDMYSGESLTTGEFTVRGEHHRYPGYQVGSQIVWGLTYRMLDQFFGMLDPDWEPRDEY